MRNTYKAVRRETWRGETSDTDAKIEKNIKMRTKETGC